MLDDRPPRPPKQRLAVDRHRREERRDERADRGVVVRRRRGHLVGVHPVDHSIEVVSVEVAPHRHPPQLEALRPRRCAALGGRTRRELPERLPLRPQRKLDEAPRELRVDRALEQRDRIGVDHRLPRRVDIAEAVESRVAQAKRRLPQRLRLIAPEEVDAEARRGLAEAHVDRGLRAGGDEGAGVPGHAAQDRPALLPAAPLQDRLHRGGHRAALPRVRRDHPAEEARVAEVRPPLRDGHAQRPEQLAVVDDPEAAQGHAVPIALRVVEHLVADPVLAVHLVDEAGRKRPRRDRRKHPCRADLAIDRHLDRARQQAELVGAAAEDQVCVPADRTPLAKRRLDRGDEHGANLARAAGRAPDDLHRLAVGLAVPADEAIAQFPTDLLVVRAHDDQAPHLRGLGRLLGTRQQRHPKEHREREHQQHPPKRHAPRPPRMAAISPWKRCAAARIAPIQVSPGRWSG